MSEFKTWHQIATSRGTKAALAKCPRCACKCGCKRLVSDGGLCTYCNPDYIAKYSYEKHIKLGLAPEIWKVNSEIRQA